MHGVSIAREYTTKVHKMREPTIFKELVSIGQRRYSQKEDSLSKGMARRGCVGRNVYLTSPYPREERCYRPCFRCRCQEDGWMTSVARMLAFVVDGDGVCWALPTMLGQNSRRKEKLGEICGRKEKFRGIFVGGG